jgi:hypothetical protein
MTARNSLVHNSTNDVIGSLIPIGAVSRATGINASTLRIWEQRYGVPKPHRTEGGARRYAPTEVQRLKLIKALVDVGHKPSNLSSLSIDELSEHLNFLTPSTPPKHHATHPLRLLTVGDAVGLKALLHEGPLADCEITHHVNDPLEIDHWLGQFDILLFNFSALQSDHAQQIIHWTKGLNTAGSLVIYTYSNSSSILALEAAGVHCLKAPAKPSEVAQALSLISQKVMASSVEPRKAEKKFTPEELETLSTLDYSLYCECPRHLAGLLMSLNGFVSYSEQCLDSSPKDAIVHQFLRNMAADAISSIETGLALVLRAEEIALSAADQGKK